MGAVMIQETKHSPEPWYDGGGRIYYKDSNRAPSQCFIAKFYASPVYGMSVKSAVLNSERVVACINACAGMADPADEIAALRARVAELEKEAGHE